MNTFSGIIPALGAALTKRGYTHLTPVQQAVLAPELRQSDLLVSAQTGSGKTVAFGLALAPTLLEGEPSLGFVAAPIALVIAPTRELALQVTRELEWLYGECGGTVASCVGGMDMRAERRALERGAHIVVGTPGRLKDHIERGYFDTSQLKAVVLDEADEMLDMGFREELQYILDTSPRERRTLMFSATIDKDIVAMATQYQKDAKRITTREEATQHADIDYQALAIAPSDRENAIINLLRYHDAKSAIIFCGTRLEVNHLSSRLTNRGFSVVALSGELSQGERSHALQALRDGRARVCVATDVASRGIDLPGLALVIHADIPKNKDILLHRSGRTGRAGSKGISALIVPHNARRRAEMVLRNAKVQANWGVPPSIEAILQRDHERFLTHPALSEPPKDDERQGIADLLARYRPEQIAAALLRVHNAQKPAPEELLDAAPMPETKKADRSADFRNSVWIKLSVGREMSAEPRWILPMLCGKGKITKRNIGAIKIHPQETHVELTADCVETFFSAVGEGGKMERNITVTRLHGTDAAPKERAHAAPQHKKHHEPRQSPERRQPSEHRQPVQEPRPHFKKRRDERPAKARNEEGGASQRPFRKPHDARKPHPFKAGGGGKPKTQGTPQARGNPKAGGGKKFRPKAK